MKSKNFIIVISIEGKESNTEKNMIKGLFQFLEYNDDKARFTAFDHVKIESSKRGRTDESFTIIQTYIEQRIKKQREFNENYFNIFNVFFIHDDDAENDRKTIDDTYNYISKKLIDIKQVLPKKIEFLNERIFNKNKSFDNFLLLFNKGKFDLTKNKSHKKSSNINLFSNAIENMNIFCIEELISFLQKNEKCNFCKMFLQIINL